MLARVLLAYIIIFITCVDTSAQVFHYKTGQVLPSSEPGTIIWKDGVFENYPARYGTLIAKETSARKARLITLPIIHIPRTNTDSLSTPIFILNGGPGETNLRKELLLSSLVGKFDMVLVGYRGVDGSTKLDCPELKGALLNPVLSSVNAASLFTEAALGCIDFWEQNFIDPQGYTMKYVLSDIKMVIDSLGYDKVNLLSFSFGTMIAQAYEWSYPDDVNKQAMVGARPLGDFVFSESTLKKQINQAVNDTNFYKHLIAVYSNDNWNKVQASIFLYGSMYTYDGILKVKLWVDAYHNGNKELLYDAFAKFYKKYPSNLVLGDVLLKKQGFGTKVYPMDSTLITSALNTWYNISPEQYDYLITEDSNSNINGLIINSQFDVASPPALNAFRYENIRYDLLLKSGHLGPFLNDTLKQKTEKLLFDFLNTKE